MVKDYVSGTSRPDVKIRHGLLKTLRVNGQTPPEPELRKVFDKYDATSDGTLSGNDVGLLVTDMVEIAIQHAGSRGASQEYVAKARRELHGPRGQAWVQQAVTELCVLRDHDGDGRLSFDEFSAALHKQVSTFEQRNRFWRVAPLVDVKVVNLDDLADPYRREKLFLAGGIAGAVSKTAGGPLSRLTILLQTESVSGSRYSGSFRTLGKTIFEREGLRGFFRGNGIDVLRAIPYTAMNYAMYEALKNWFRDAETMKLTTKDKAMAGGISGVGAILATYPLDLLRTRVATTERSHPNSIISRQLRQILAREGPVGLFRGCTVSCIQVFPNLALNFSLYEMLRDILAGAGYISVGASLGSGIVAGAIANTAVFPLSLIARNLQIDDGSRYRGAWDCGMQVVERHGIRGLFRGLGVQLCKAIPVGSVSFATYDKMRRVLDLELAP